jgi:hypothetical protein
MLEITAFPATTISAATKKIFSFIKPGCNLRATRDVSSKRVKKVGCAF